ncbi:MAG: glucosamine-6-phosphate deaminase [Clostridia bacterium]|nr:glucosamine-6-phosphate deaminase [Clostridia bacterium]
MKQFTKDTLLVKAMETRAEMGKVAAEDIRAKILSLLETKKEINMIFAAAPSQNDVLASLISYSDIPWNRIHAFHMDEYIGLDERFVKQSFGTFLTDHIFGKVPFASVHLINSTATDPEAECERYSQLLRENPTDIVVMGIGENGHIAFNDPWIADFNDPKMVKVVPLDEVCRQQQVNDGCFPSIDCVPKQAISLTCPTLTAGSHLFCIVPAKTKANAVKHTLEDAISEDCPATALRRHPSAVLYLDADSSSLL